jgi:predicted TIM-barrel fold metal-dependent hydrolase
LKGLRIFTGGSTKDFDPTELENPAAYPAWDLLGDLGLPMCIQTGPIGLPQVRDLAVRFPKVNIILDHLGRPDVLDGPPYANADSLFALADLPNIYLKLTPRIMGDVTKGQASAETFFPKVAAVFGANRLAWGSNFPTSPGTLAEILATARQRLACLSEEDQSWVFAKTAQTLYPALAD